MEETSSVVEETGRTKLSEDRREGRSANGMFTVTRCVIGLTTNFKN